MASFYSEYPLWLAGVAILPAFFAAFILYRKSKLEISGQYAKVVKGVLTACRFLSLYLILLLLLGIIWSRIHTKTEKPLLVIAMDNSLSIASKKNSEDYKKTIVAKTTALKNKLSDKFDVKTYLIGSNTRPEGTPDFSDKQTNISQALETFSDSYINQPLAGVVLVTDGIYNEGANPLYAISGLHAPIYTLGLGDTTQHKDALISNVRHNKLVYLGNTFPLEIDVRAFSCKNETVRIAVSSNGKELSSKQVTVTSDNYFSQNLFELSASEAGTYHLTIDITKLKGEVSYANNRYEVFVQCIKGQQKILLAALAPHPDVSAYRRMIEKNENYSCELVYAPELLKTDVTKYQLCVLHQLPGNLGEATVFIKNAKEHKVPVLYVLGSETNIGLFNQLESTFSIYTNRQSLSEAQASINNEFSLFTLTTEEQASIEKFPPLICPYGTFKMNTPADVFLKQQIGNVITDNPLIAFTSSQGDKTGFIFGEGFWKWALYDAQQAQQHTTENILSKIVQYLSVKSDNRYLRINAKKRYDENEPILIDAELYNPSYELINTPEITIDIEHTSGKKYTYVFSKTEKSYTLQAGVLPTGSYRYTATATIGNKTEKSQGVFYIQPLQLELMQTTANHHLLHQMAHESNGAFADLQHADDLVEKISNNEHSKPVMYTTKEKTPLIELTWLLAFIIALFSVEWFIRKWNGSI